MERSKIKSILLVDDNEADNFIHSKIIAKSKIVSENNIFIRKNGEEALQFLKNYEEGKSQYGDSYPPSLILLDVNMPIMNGFEFLEKFETMSKKDGYSSIVVVMLTSSLNKDDRERADNFSAVQDYVPKPISKQSIVDICQKFFEIE